MQKNLERYSPANIQSKSKRNLEKEKGFVYAKPFSKNKIKLSLEPSLHWQL